MKIPNLKSYLLLEASAAVMLLAYVLFSTMGTSQAPIQAKDAQDGFTPIFDGKSIQGWEFDPVYWSVKDGAIVGEITAATLLKNNTFIIWKGGELGDFELKVDYWISENGNSGVQYRSDRYTELPYALKGYQADIDGANNRTTLLL
jgi:hypothetical protein